VINSADIPYTALQRIDGTRLDKIIAACCDRRRPSNDGYSSERDELGERLERWFERIETTPTWQTWALSGCVS
jgi:hypothetical protein